ncbi:HAD family hydrolase [Streptomyces profundus]|uniref:HAD family hydrolase n=1 Tax=Streptomyces profundus TaxID=2867410 RepID=UPI001D1695E5|nr:HAD family hydrolase [Streptomyces sp. MA3_2.13]UED86684.1 HAD family hydrolase [Streptomyces sp. MA3_2.13]
MPAPRTLIASDLDRTLIYSAGALALTEPDHTAPRLLSVETYQGRPQSFVTETAATLLAALAADPRAVFVPTTTRTRRQYLRVRLPGPPPPYAICANGGHLLVDGETDEGWHRSVRDRLAADCATLDEITARVRRTADPSWLLRERTAEDLFAYLVVDRERLPDAWPKTLAAWAEPRGWTVSLQGRKLYVVPAPLTKSAAVAEVARRAGTARTLAAGDSLLDADLLLAADLAWRPGHGELATGGWSADHVVELPDRGVGCGETILRAFQSSLP